MSAGIVAIAAGVALSWLADDGARPAAVGVAVLLGTAVALLVLLVRERRRAAERAELVARAAHELRGPLAAAHLAVQALGRRPGTARADAAAVDLQLQRAALALADLAAASRGGGPEDRRGLVDVGDLLAEQARAWGPMAEAYGADLRLVGGRSGARVRGDRLRLGQAIGNVVANAVEHGGGPIELSARSVGGRVRIEVADHGPGLPSPPAALAARRRAASDHRGRGLAIASDIVGRHGGLLISAPSDHGARIALDLPAAEPLAARLAR